MIQLYIDPGTGSMLFTILIGVISAGVYSFRMFLLKLRYKTTGGKEEQGDKIPFVFFSDDKRYWTVFEPVCREMQERGQEIVYLTMSADDPVFDCAYPNIKAEFIGSGNKAFARLNVLNAFVVLATTPGLDVYQWKRSKQADFYVHIPHAASEITMYRMFGLDYYDAILLSGDYQERDIRNLEALREIEKKELVTIGIPYMDEMIKRLEQVREQAGAEAKTDTTVLLAPSWGKSALFEVYGDKIIDALMKTGYHIIIRPHPQSFASEKELMDRLMADYPSSEQLEWNRDTDNFDVLRRSDILISDFSGVVFEFSLIYDKPVIYTDPQFDLSLYDAWWLDTPLWTTSALPRLGRQLTGEYMDNLKDLIETCLQDPQFAEGRKQVRQETWEHCGEGAKRAADYLIGKYEKIIAAEETKGVREAEQK